MTITQPLSLYIHIPFCKQKCRYCDFYSIASDQSLISDYITALAHEWRLVRDHYHLLDTPIKTIFCGGGTPSILSVEQWQTLNTTLFSSLNLTPDYEWTIECNPDSFTKDKAALWQKMGVTRLTFGIQSLHERELSLLGRIHTAEQAVAVLHDPILQTFSSIGVDIMYGIPEQTVQSLSDTLNQLLALPIVNHCSAYELTIAEQTPFYNEREILALPSEDTTLEMTQTVLSKARSHGFDQYEVSNFAKPGFACKHNMAYWDLSPYFGLGPGAHSFINGHRTATVSDVSAYCTAVASNHLPIAFTETTTADMLEKEIIFLRLRTREGLDENWFAMKTENAFQNEYRNIKLEGFVKHGFLEYVPPFWRCTDTGMSMVDALVRELVV